MKIITILVLSKAMFVILQKDKHSESEYKQAIETIKNNITDIYTLHIVHEFTNDGVTLKQYLPGLARGNEALISDYLTTIGNIMEDNSDMGTIAEDYTGHNNFASEVCDCLCEIPDNKLILDDNHNSYTLHIIVSLQKSFNKLKRISEYRIMQEKLNSNYALEKLQEKHEKEIEELLRPGNKGALAAENRFEFNSGTLEQETKEEIKGLDEA